MLGRLSLPNVGATLQGSGRAKQGAVALAALLLLALLAWLGWVGAGTREEVRLAAQRAVRVAELRGSIAYLDEWLTMSAQMATATGETRWVERYDEASPKLEAVIAEAVALATPEVSAALARTTDEAHRDLVTMQRAVFRLAAEGDRDTARALLDSPEYAYLKEVYASGIEVFGQELETLAAARAAKLHDRAWMEMAGLALGAVFLVAAAFVSRGRARLQAALAHTEAVARTDALTGLPNRRALYEAMQAALAPNASVGAAADATAAAAAATGRTSDGLVALLLLDLDRFKPVNDVHGHPAGDHLLQLVASRLRIAARAGDLIARLGGDEFALLVPLPNGGGPSRPPTDVASQVARRIIAALEEPFELPGSSAVVQVGASIGVALSQPGEDVDMLVHSADVALYRAKAEGRGRHHFFEPGMDAQVRARALLETDLRQAVADDAILPYFQPLVALDTGRLIGFEMLARWPHPTRGMVSPAEFIPVAEDTGLIGPMTASLLRRACRIAAADWPDGVMLACNISPLQLRDRGLPGTVRAVLDESGLPAHRLELEITESALVGDLDLARNLLDQLKALGVRLSLDDFGTGYSSLRHLQTLPFDKLKIDAAFVGAMAGDVESRKIVAAVVGLGQSLGLLTVAEGVETEETAALLRSLGCDIGQGWLFGRPAPADAAARLLTEDAGEGRPPRRAGRGGQPCADAALSRERVTDGRQQGSARSVEQADGFRFEAQAHGLVRPRRVAAVALHHEGAAAPIGLAPVEADVEQGQAAQALDDAHLSR